MLLNVRNITLLLILNTFLATSETESFSAYLFAYFTGNSGDQEAIRFALSDDGHNFKALNKNKPILNSADISSTGGVRDPHILRGENNDYYMVATDMVSAQGWNSNRGLVMLKSTNLIDWTSSKVNIPKTFTKYASADRVWAPQTIYDQNAKKYMIYFAMRLGQSDADKIYYAYANSTFTAFESEPKVLYSYNGSASIDGDIIYKDNTYYLFFKNEGNGNGIKSARSKVLTGGYTLYDKYLQQTTAQVEGSCVFKLFNSDKYVLMYDVYTSGRYEFATSTDLVNFSKDPVPISFDFTPRHGTVIPITASEKQTLNSKWSLIRVSTVPDKKEFLFKFSQKKKHLELVFEGISLTDPTVTVMDLTGRIRYQGAITNGINRIEISGLSPGVYQVCCKSESGYSRNTKIVVR